MDDSKKLEEFLNRMANDSDFEKRAKEDKNVLAELGWSPEEISGFQVKPRDDDYWGCGTDCGCKASTGEGNGHACSGGHGS